MKPAISVAILLGLATGAFASLGVGDKAPPIKVANIVKGLPVSLSAGTHVVEFWATWCGPCKMSIPHLTELAKKFKGKVDFTGVSVWENGDNQLGQVKSFVKTMGPKMAYNVAFDGPSKFMATKWMEAAGQDGIPTAFVVKNGVVLWIGHPMDGLEETLTKVTAGHYSVAEAKKAFAAKQVEAAAAMKAQQAQAASQQKEMQPYIDALKAGDVPGQIKALTDLEAKHPEMKQNIELTKAMLLITLGDKQGYAITKAAVEGDMKDNAQYLNQVAWTIVQPKPAAKDPDYAFAAEVGKKAAALMPETPEILDTYAVALFKSGDKAKAIEVETKAVAILTKGGDPQTLKDFQGRLAEFKKA